MLILIYGLFVGGLFGNRVVRFYFYPSPSNGFYLAVSTVLFISYFFMV